jgi:RNA polymerase sigma-70 factor (ECF subfamily)
MNLFDAQSALPLPGDRAVAEQERDDAELIESFLSGEDQGFAVLLDRHMPMVYRFVYRYLGNADDTNDVTQETFIRAWKHLTKFDRSRSFKTWILTIAKNASLDFIKKKKPILFSRIEAEEADLDAFLAPYTEAQELSDAMFDRKSTARSLEAVVERLPLPYRVVLTLRYVEHLKFREIADALDEPIDTVKSKHRRGLMQLRKLMPREL